MIGALVVAVLVIAAGVCIGLCILAFAVASHPRSR